MRDSIWGFLQAESLEIDAGTAVWDDEVRIHGAFHPASILTVATLFHSAPVKVTAGSRLNKLKGTQTFPCGTHTLHLRGRA